MFLLSAGSQIHERNWPVVFLESNVNGERAYYGLGLELQKEIYKDLYSLFLDDGYIFFESSNNNCIRQTIGKYSIRCSFKLKEDGLHWSVEEED